MSAVALHEFLDQAAARWPDQTAVLEPGGGSITYRALAQLSDKVRDHLVHLGVRPGDRVGLCLRKSIDAVAALFGILKTGAAYVPVDAAAPASRNATIFSDCQTCVVVIQQSCVTALATAWPTTVARPTLLTLEVPGGGRALAAALAASAAPPAVTAQPGPDDRAYILYTSGSTGVPKGVTLSHENAVSFVTWCGETFAPTSRDRFSSHAPFHFDLSILDIYLPLRHGATVVLISEETGKSPGQLAPLIAEQRISVWYSTPSILSMLTQYGKLEDHDWSALRLVLFAGEVFPLKHLRVLKQRVPHPRYFNLYGPTETNVCTYYELPAAIPAARSEPFPIGKACSHLATRVLDGTGRPVAAREEGELCVRGAGVMQGYWNRPEQTARAFVTTDGGQSWYRTGDLVREDANGDYVFFGRRDRMVKKRGYRVELGEIEAGLYRHPEIAEAAVLALADEEQGVTIKAFLVCRGAKPPSLIGLKGFCARELPAYMIPDRFAFLPRLPKTSTDKVDYQALHQLSQA